ncbi:MAG: cytochrome c oxidase assembly protein [Gemmatimonadales bacterium]|nr:MAG: cytochrome c oxidase assembly protein [Gemmatimonadales bacterium]
MVGGRRFRLAFGLLGGIVAWILHLGGSYALVELVCPSGNMTLLHLLTVGMAVVATAAVASAWSCLRWRGGGGAGAGAGGGDGGGGGGGRSDGSHPHTSSELTRFLAMGGVFTSGFFLFLIVAEGLPALLGGDPCAHVPTLDRPIIFRGPGAPGSAAMPGLLMAGWGGAGAPFLAGLAHARGLVPPGEAWFTWNPDPWILLGLAAMAGTYLLGVRRLWARAGKGRGLPPWRVGAYLAGIWILVLALVSPIDPLGETLFSVHMVQHMLLMVVAAPLLVLGRPHIGWLWALPRRHLRTLATHWNGAGAGKAPESAAEGAARGAVGGVRSAWRGLTHPVTVLVLHVGALWIWHIPAFYEAALTNTFLHSLEHASFLGTAVLFWWALDRSGRGGRWPGYGAAVLYVFATALQAGALGALLLFAPSPWYPAHAEGAALWGLDPGVDQQLAGAIMWIPGGLVYAAAMALLFVAWMRRSGRDGARMEVSGWGAVQGA